MPADHSAGHFKNLVSQQRVHHEKTARSKRRGVRFGAGKSDGSWA
jgi:hypothetical protein